MNYAAAALFLLCAPPAQAGGHLNQGDLEENLRIHVYQLSEKIGERDSLLYRQLLRARDYIAGTFTDYGYRVESQEYRVWDNTFENLIARLPGSGGPEAGILVVGAHYDTAAGTPGADDNASGVAGLLELARLLKAASPRKTIVFVAFSTEEPPYFGTELMGSRFYAQEAVKKGEKIEGMIGLEMIGYFDREAGSQRYPPLLRFFYPERGDFIALVGNWRSRIFLKRLAGNLKGRTKVPLEYAVLPAFLPGVSYSDHSSFWKEGIPAVMVTDTAFYRNPHYHDKSDRFATLDYSSMASLVSGLAEALVELAK